MSALCESESEYKKHIYKSPRTIIQCKKVQRNYLSRTGGKIEKNSAREDAPDNQLPRRVRQPQIGANTPTAPPAPLQTLSRSHSPQTSPSKAMLSRSGRRRTRDSRFHLHPSGGC